MQKKILAYEKFIAGKVSDELSEKERTKLAELHCEMVRNFQHERLIHLIVTLFFTALSLIALSVSAWIFATTEFSLYLLPIYFVSEDPV